jgi:Rieske [2Fe-2S] domain
MLSKQLCRVTAIARAQSVSSSNSLRFKLSSTTTPLTTSWRSSFSSTYHKMAEFKLKDLSSLDLKNGDKVEAQVEGIEGGKVLLVKLDGKVHAMNANCTHYGAPLKNGILTPEGRLTCPWHGGQSIWPLNIGRRQLIAHSLLQCPGWRDRECACTRSLDQI